MHLIQDEFTKLPLSRQRKWQLRNQRDKRCTVCGEKAVGWSLCLKHMVTAREQQRQRLGLKRRYPGARSYLVEGRAA